MPFLMRMSHFLRLIRTKPVYVFNVLLIVTFLYMLYLLSNQYHIYHENQILMQPKLIQHGSNQNNSHNFSHKSSTYRFIRNVSSSDRDRDNDESYDGHDKEIEEILANIQSAPSTRTVEHEHARRNWFGNIFKRAAQQFYNIFHPKTSQRLTDLRTWAIGQQRRFLKAELNGYELYDKDKKLDDLIMEKGGQPLRNAIFTTWRSGSTFLAEVIEAIPGHYYHYEPLLHMEIVRVRSGALAQEGLRVVRDLFNCDYANLSDYIQYGEEHHWLLNHNSRIWQYCEDNHQICLNSDFLSTMCKMFPFQILKTVRMRLRLARPFLDDPKLNIRILLLVRDPRGTLQSRRHREWCPGNPDCESPARLCHDLEDDYKTARRFRKKYPGRFMALRYEDISLNPYSAVKKLFNFFHLTYDSRIDEYLDNHTVVDVGGVSSTFRDSKNAPFHWRQDLATEFDEVERIQTQCAKAMRLWGYKPALNTFHMLGLNPLDAPPWPEMNIEPDKAHNSSLSLGS